MSEALRIVVVDDHALFRRGLVGLLSDMQEFQVVGEAENGEEALAVIESQRPDVVLLDINMPGMGGLETLKVMKKQAVESHVLMLTISQREEDLLGAIRAGADGYLLKNSEPDVLRNTILQVAAGNSVLSPEVTSQIFHLVRSGQVGAEGILTERELDVLRLLARGQTTSQAAGELYISENTVKTHIRHILTKLEVGNRTEAIARASQLGLL